MLYFATTWIELKGVMLIEIGQEKDKYKMRSLTCGVKKKSNLIDNGQWKQILALWQQLSLPSRGKGMHEEWSEKKRWTRWNLKRYWHFGSECGAMVVAEILTLL